MWTCEYALQAIEDRRESRCAMLAECEAIKETSNVEYLLDRVGICFEHTLNNPTLELVARIKGELVPRVLEHTQPVEKEIAHRKHTLFPPSCTSFSILHHFSLISALLVFHDISCFRTHPAKYYSAT